MTAWDEGRAVSWLAVHFCSAPCKDRYVEQLFGRALAEAEVVDEVAVPARGGRKVLAMTRRQRTPSRPVNKRKTS